MHRFTHMELASQEEEEEEEEEEPQAAAAVAIVLVLVHNIGFRIGASCYYWHIASHAAEHVTDAVFMIAHELKIRFSECVCVR